MVKDIADILTKEAYKLGFCDIGFARVSDQSDQASYPIFEKWLEGQNHATMLYLEKYRRYRQNIRNFLPFAKSVIGVLLPYPVKASNPYISSYVTKPDYHKYIKNSLKKLLLLLEDKINTKLEFFIAVDTAITSERGWAVKCGLGWIGKQGMLVNPLYGCCVFIGLAFVNIELPQKEILQDNCKDCNLCVHNCPKGVIKSDRTIAAQECISFLTIEYRGEFSEYTSLNGSLYGCDKCSSCCPWNNNRTFYADNIKLFGWLENSKEIADLTPERCLVMNETEFKELSNNTPLQRVNLAILQRNARKVIKEKKYAID